MTPFPVMFIFSILAALLSSMSVWADKWSDVRLSLNDFYMAFLMTGWMFFLEGSFHFHLKYILFGIGLIVLSFFAIRTQFLVGVREYVRGMIPHHSMAVLMSKRLVEKYGDTVFGNLPKEIIQGQESEIRYMKSQGY
jgi:hypothetical protein